MFELALIIFQLVIDFFTEPVIGEATVAIGPLAAVGVSAASSLAGKGINALFNDRPDIPDFVSEVQGQFDNQRRNLSQQQDRQTEEVQADAAAAGVNPVTAMADVIESNNQAQADLSGREADAVARAQNRERQMRFGQDQRKFQSRAQGIGGIVSGISNFVSNKSALDQQEKSQEDFLKRLQKIMGDQTNPLLGQTMSDLLGGTGPSSAVQGVDTQAMTQALAQ